MASKNVELKKKIGSDVYDLNVKTDASMVSYDGLSVKDALDAYTNSIDGLEQASSGLDTRVESLETAVGGVSSGLVKDVSDLDEAINNASTGIAARVGTLEGASVVMTGATSAADGAQGFVPAPATGDQDKFLNGAGQWATPNGATYSAATTGADGLMSSTDKAKLESIAASANNYSHPAHTSRAAGMYKITVDAEGHVSDASAVGKNDITGLGIPESDTTYSAATTTADGLMSSTDKAKLESIAASANNYSHPSYNSAAAGLYKVAVDATGHVSSVSTVEKADITALGVPASDTTYSDATTAASGLMSSADKTKLNGLNNYTHPAHDSAASGLYKVTVDAEGHVSATTAVEKSDITGLGIPGSDTTYAAATTGADGLMSSSDKEKLDGLSDYTHPSYDSHASGLYKVAVDDEGHVSSAASVEKSDITGLGIPGSDTTYAAATTAVEGLMAAEDKAKLESIAASANNYSHPSYDSAASGLYKVAVDATGHVNSVSAVEKADITALGVPASDTTYAAATTAAEGLMSAAQVSKLESIAASANNYSHPTYTSKAAGLYKITVDATGHVSGTTAAAKADITGLGIPGSDTTYADATTAAHGLMTTAQVSKLESIAASANNYSHPTYTSKAAGLYKVAVDSEGHVSGTTAVGKSDITGLGIPGSDTTYADATTAAHGLMPAADKTKLESIAASANNYSHPSFTSKAAGLYKISVNAEGHVSGTTAVAKADITGLGIPGSDTTYADGTTATHGLLSTTDKAKLDSIAASANNYSHPSYTSKAAGLYKMTVDGTGHVSGTTAVVAGDITGLGIASTAAAATNAAGLMSADDKKKLNSIAASANNYSHPAHTSHASGLYKVAVDAEGHVSGATAVSKADITGLGIPGSDTTYADATTAAHGLMSTADKVKLNGLENYSHPTYTSKASGLYKVTVDAEGHVSAAADVQKSDITGLGIPGSDTTYADATTSAHGLMSTADKVKLNGLENYSHPTYTSKAAGLYKMTVDGTGHVSGTTAVAKADITGLGIPGSDTTYADATTSAHGLMSTADKVKLNGLENYSHPTYTSKAAGLYKVAVDSEGHVSGTTAVGKSDITGLGIPGSDTTYADATTAAHGLMPAADKTKLESIAASANNYSHPSFTSKAAGLYKISVNAEGHVSGTTAVAKADITGLGIPGSDTTYADATTAAHGLMTTAQVSKLESIAASANNYSHPTYTSKAAGLYKMTVDGTGHVSGTTAVVAGDITGLGIASTAAAATNAAGLMSADDKKKLDSIAASANKYSHPSYTSKAAGLYKITVDGTGHVSGTTAAAKADITGLGIPGSDTTYADATTAAHGLMTTAQVSKLESIAASANNYSHPSYTSKAAGIYKMTVDATGHVSGTTAVAKADITGLGIPGSDTTYAAATTAVEGLMAAEDKAKLESIAASANNYSHPSYTSKAAGLYKMTVDGTGHVSGTTAVAAGDITGLGIASTAAAATNAAGLMSADDKKKLNSIAASANNYSHPSYTSKAAGLYKITVDATGHVSGTTAAAKADITGLGIPGSDTTYADATTAAHGLMTTAQVSKLESIAASANNYSHPTYTSKAAGLYKMTVDGTGHVSGTTAVAKADITGLGIPGSDTTYADATTSAHGLMTTADKAKLDSIAASANKYSHPSYTSKAAGLYKITVDGTGHVSGTTAVGDASTAAAGLMTKTDKAKLDSIAASANKYSHPSYTSKAAGLYKMTVDSTGHVSGTTAVAKADITGLGIASTAAAATNSAGLMSADDKKKLNSIAASANNYSHPSYTSHASGLYKITVDATGHVSATASAPLASTAGSGVVQVGANISVSDGVISLTETNVTDALGYVPIGASYDSSSHAIVFGPPLSSGS